MTSCIIHFFSPLADQQIRELLRLEFLTFSDDSLQPDDVGVVKLAHDAGFSQEVPPLLLSVANFQGFDGH